MLIIGNLCLQPPGIQVIQVDGANDSDSEDDDDDDEDDLEDDKKDKSQEGLDDADLDVSIVQSFSKSIKLSCCKRKVDSATTCTCTPILLT